MILTMYRNDLPDWAKSKIKTTCSYCGSFIADNSDTGVTTARWCVNPICPGHMMHRMKFVADFFHVKNFGPESALSYIRMNKCTNHLEILKEWYTEEKPLVSLSDVAVLACIEGYGATQANQELNVYSSFEEYFSVPMRVNQVLRDKKDYLIECSKYFNIKPALASRKMLVMGTGSFHNFTNRDEFFKLVNDAYGQYVQVIQTGKRKGGVSYLIKEADAVDHSKSQIARENGIPIVTPKEFIAIIASMCPYINEE